MIQNLSYYFFLDWLLIVIARNKNHIYNDTYKKKKKKKKKTKKQAVNMSYQKQEQSPWATRTSQVSFDLVCSLTYPLEMIMQTFSRAKVMHYQ